PRHPYSSMLLSSLPRLDQGEPRELQPIPGAPPDCLELPPGCPFAPRCDRVLERCLQENPPLRAAAGDHRVACWAALDSQEGSL
ncbi:MAG: oligopeptide/dipeptide ABC transporter ATP-binding protein, partial [Chloroflexota bacterium]